MNSLMHVLLKTEFFESWLYHEDIPMQSFKDISAYTNRMVLIQKRRNEY